MASMTCVRDEVFEARAGARRRASAAALVLAGVWAAVWAVSLSRSLFDPIGFDQAAWQYATERVLAGDRMYVDVWDQNAPGVLAVHGLSTRLAGRSPMALRVFDAGWQLLTMAALVLLCVRDGRRWSAGWLAAVLYALAYYGTGYVHTAQRDGFAVLPVLLMLHGAACPGGGPRGRGLWVAVLAGVMGFAAFAIKPPLGLCAGAVWVYLLVELFKAKRTDERGWGPLAALSLGFAASCVAAAAAMVHLGWWEAFVETMGRSDVPGYIQGPRLVRQMLPGALLAAVVLGVAAAAMVRARGPRGGVAGAIAAGRLWLAATVVCVALLTVVVWSDWQPIAIGLAGLWIPAGGAVVSRPWAGRSRLWRLVLLAACASAAAVVLQGRFYLYHIHPLAACAAFLAATEIVEVVSRGRREGDARGPRAGLWGAACLAAVVFVAIGFWGRRMTWYSDRPFVLSGTTLAGHYDRVTRQKARYPLYSTTVKAAERVRALTGPAESIACLLNEPRLYYLSQRPGAGGLIIPNEAFRPRFEAFIEAILARRPAVVLARLPAGLSAEGDLGEVTEGVLREAEAYYGPAARGLRGAYRVTEVIDDVCLLRR